MAYTTIDDPSAHFQTALYTGTGSSRSVTNDGNSDLQPDWIWIKERDGTGQHGSFDSSRGVQKELKIDDNSAEATASQSVTAFNSDGFTVGTAGDYNGSSNLQVAWQWKANGGTTSSNTDGDITSTVQNNSTAGFSIGTFTGSSSNTDSVGHGLGGTPAFIIMKSTDSANAWTVWHQNLGGTSQYYLVLNTSAAQVNYAPQWTTAPSSTIIYCGSDDGQGGNSTLNYVCYAWKAVAGVSAFGSHSGQVTSVTGTTVGANGYCGFRPKFVLIKSISASQAWLVFDQFRSGTTIYNDYLIPDTTAAEEVDHSTINVTPTALGFTTGSHAAVAGGTCIWAAFA